VASRLLSALAIRVICIVYHAVTPPSGGLSKRGNSGSSKRAIIHFFGRSGSTTRARARPIRSAFPSSIAASASPLRQTQVRHYLQAVPQGPRTEQDRGGQVRQASGCCLGAIVSWNERVECTDCRLGNDMVKPFQMIKFVTQLLCLLRRKLTQKFEDDEIGQFAARPVASEDPTKTWRIKVDNVSPDPDEIYYQVTRTQHSG
jgi:hypothetical protein